MKESDGLRTTANTDGRPWLARTSTGRCPTLVCTTRRSRAGLAQSPGAATASRTTTQRTCAHGTRTGPSSVGFLTLAHGPLTITWGSVAPAIPRFRCNGAALHASHNRVTRRYHRTSVSSPEGITRPLDPDYIA